MKKRYFGMVLLILLVVFIAGCAEKQGDAVMEDFMLGELKIRYFGHSSFALLGRERVFIDPFKISGVNRADVIIATHDHYDHCAPTNIGMITFAATTALVTEGCKAKINQNNKIEVLTVGQTINLDGVKVTAVPAYNIDKEYHAKDDGFGVIVEMNGKKIYHAGDTDKIPEMADLANENIDVALLPIGGTYTMDVKEAAEAAKMIKPKIVIPMHYNVIEGTEAEPQELVKLLEGSGIEVVVLIG